MPEIHLENFDDARLGPYRNLTDRQLEVMGNRFVVEGLRRVQRLLASDFPVESVVVAESRLQKLRPLIAEPIPLYVLPDEPLAQVVGYHIHTGILACAFRKPWPSIERMMSGAGRPATWLICPQIKNTENLGALARISAAFGITGLLLGPTSCDPFCRRSVRVSMGTVFRLPLQKSDDLESDLRSLRDRFGVTLYAAVLADDAEALPPIRRGATEDVGILLGHEDWGLEPGIVELCRRKVTIPMRMGTDSLNVSVAAAVFLYHFMQPAVARVPEAADDLSDD